MNIYEIYKAVEFYLNKDQFGRHFSVSKFNSMIPVVEIDLFKQRYGLPQEYQPGMPIPRMSYEITQKISDDVSPMKVWMGSPNGPSPLTVNTDGVANLPPNYVHFSSSRTLDGYPIEMLSDSEFNERLMNPNRTPSLRYPIMTTYARYIQFQPKDIQQVHFVYLRLPVYAALAVTIDPNTDVEVYDSVNSRDTEFPEDMHTEYIRRMLMNMGVNLRSEIVMQYSNMPEK
jgi:hypothetical protein